MDYVPNYDNILATPRIRRRCVREVDSHTVDGKTIHPHTNGHDQDYSHKKTAEPSFTTEDKHSISHKGKASSSPVDDDVDSQYFNEYSDIFTNWKPSSVTMDIFHIYHAPKPDKKYLPRRKHKRRRHHTHKHMMPHHSAPVHNTEKQSLPEPTETQTDPTERPSISNEQEVIHSKSTKQKATSLDHHDNATSHAAAQNDKGSSGMQGTPTDFSS